MSGIIKILFLIVISIGIYLLAYDQLTPPTRRISHTLFQMEKYLERLLALDAETNEMLKMDPFDELVEEVRPLVETVSSISTQTGIYERMERIPGGPQTFMTPSLTKLDKLQLQLHGFEARYRLILAAMNRNMSTIVNRDMKRLRDDFITVFAEPETSLHPYRIYMTPDEDGGTTGTVLINTTLNSILYWITQLQKYFAELESSLPDGDCLKFLQGYVKNPTMEQTMIAKTIHDITVKHGESTFPQIGYLWVQAMKRFNQKLDDIRDHLNAMKRRYEELASGVDSDITSTRERIRNLANLNSKKIEL